MEAREKILKAVRYFGGTILALGILMFTIGLTVNGYNYLSSIGIGTVMGAIFIFLMGVFFVALEEMLEKQNKGVIITPIKPK